ncbi:MAG: FtsQ-type POTRA domain-containing protein [bacterium]|nr:FtsQ-type POTRA domain-containing protein [bacterium]MBU1918472.1 FtsQ-type POTRA domain-containing protein [bacterium]
MLWSEKKKNRKWQERPMLYKGRFYYIRRVLHVFTAFIIAACFVSLWMYLHHSDTLSIKKIDILGDLIHVTKQNIVTLTQLENSDKLFAVELRSIQDNIQKHYWIKEAKVRRKFPDTLQIHITERMPKAILMTHKMYLVDDTGKVFKKIEKNDNKDLPVITGFTDDFIKKNPYLAKRHFNFTMAILKFLEKQNYYQEDPISEIHFDSVSGFTIFTKDSGLEVYYGRKDFVRKQKVLEKFKLSKHYNENNYVRLDLNKLGRIIARKN